MANNCLGFRVKTDYESGHLLQHAAVVLLMILKATLKDSTDRAALHALLGGKEGDLPIEAGVTSDPLSGSKSGSRGSTAGQGTIANTEASTNNDTPGGGNYGSLY